MVKYTQLQIEFNQGYADGRWKSVNQFAIAKGIDPNGYIKRAAKGWKKQAEELRESLTTESQDKAKDEFIERAKKDWEIIYKNLGEATSIMAKKIKEYAKQTEFTYTDAQGELRLDAKAIKALIDAGTSAVSLHKKTYIKEDIPLSAESRQKIEEAKLVKDAGDGKKADTTIEDRIAEKMKAHGFDK